MDNKSFFFLWQNAILCHCAELWNFLTKWNITKPCIICTTMPRMKKNSPYDMANLGMTLYIISNNANMVHLCINYHANKKNIETYLTLCTNHLYTWLHCSQHNYSTSNFFLFLTLECTWSLRTRASPRPNCGNKFYKQPFYKLGQHFRSQLEHKWNNFIIRPNIIIECTHKSLVL